MADLAGRRVLDSISSDVAAIPHAFVVSGLISHPEPARGLGEIAQDLVLGLVSLPWQGLEQIDHNDRSAGVGGDLNQTVLPKRELQVDRFANQGATSILREFVSPSG